MDPTDVAIQDRPELIELVTNLKKAIPLDINIHQENIADRELRPLKKNLMDSLGDLENVWQRFVSVYLKLDTTFHLLGVPSTSWPNVVFIHVYSLHT